MHSKLTTVVWVSERGVFLPFFCNLKYSITSTYYFLIKINSFKNTSMDCSVYRLKCAPCSLPSPAVFSPSPSSLTSTCNNIPTGAPSPLLSNPHGCSHSHMWANSIQSTWNIPPLNTFCQTQPQSPDLLSWLSSPSTPQTPCASLTGTQHIVAPPLSCPGPLCCVQGLHSGYHHVSRTHQCPTLVGTQ